MATATEARAALGYGRQTTLQKVIDRQLAKRADVFDDIERFYNLVPRHSTIGYLSPVELEKKVGLAWPGVRRTGSSSSAPALLDRLLSLPRNMAVHSGTRIRSELPDRHVRQEMAIESMNVFVIGACNVNDSIYALASDGSIRPPVVAGIRKVSDGHTPYVHSGQEAVQFVRYVREDTDIPKSIRKYVFTDTDFSPKGRGAALDEADVILFEFSTPLEIEFGEFRLNRNELQRRLIDPLRREVPALAEALGQWFHEGILKANSERAASAAADVLAGLPNDAGDAAEWRELIRGTRGRLLSDEEIVGLLRQLNEMLRVKLAVVMPSLQYTPDGRGWGWPSEFTGQLEDACAELRLPLLDFSTVIRRHGTDAALMPDLYHHKPGFTGFLDEILRFTREVVAK